MSLIIHWIVAAILIIIAAYILPGVTVSGFLAALLTALVLGIINVFIKPIINFLALPLNVLTLGLFSIVINALLIMLAAAIVPGFYVANFWWALLFGVVLWILNYIMHQFTESTESRTAFR